MESNGKEGMIQVSETTKRILEKALPGEYRFEKNADVHVKPLNKTYEGYLVFFNESEDSLESVEDLPM